MRTRFADAAQHADAYFVIRAISTGHIRKTSETEEKCHADWTNRHILEQMHCEENRQNGQFPVYQ